MEPRFSGEEAIEAIRKDFANNKRLKLRPTSKLSAEYVQKLLGASKEEMYIILNSPDDKARLRTNLEEEASYHMFRRINASADSDDEIAMMDFYRDAIEGIDYQCFDEVRMKGGWGVGGHEQYRLECEDAFPRRLEALTIHFEEFARFVYCNPEMFCPQGYAYDFSKIKFGAAKIDESQPSTLQAPEEERASPQTTSTRGRPFKTESWKESVMAITMAIIDVLKANSPKTNGEQFEKLCQAKMKEVSSQKGGLVGEDKVKADAIKAAYAVLPAAYKDKRSKKKQSKT
ncbi:MAG: hypothetical protein J5855_07085 [Mailhella sp.]|nr:hypothetical protein [Mailhella sp.]